MNTNQPSLFAHPSTPAKRISEPSKARPNAERINTLIRQMRTLHEELNVALYAAKSADRPNISSPADAAALLVPGLSPLDQEELWVILLDRRNNVKQIVPVYRGSVSSSQVRVGELFKDAIAQNASAIVIAHNHPSGDPTPSPDDVAVTRAIVQAGKLLDIEVLDHIIVGFQKWVSLKERGLGFVDVLPAL